MLQMWNAEKAREGETQKLWNEMAPEEKRKYTEWTDYPPSFRDYCYIDKKLVKIK